MIFKRLVLSCNLSHISVQRSWIQDSLSPSLFNDIFQSNRENLTEEIEQRNLNRGNCTKKLEQRKL